MNAVATREIEKRRQQEQARLDSLKTAQERNKWGQFATPPELALSIARYAHSLLEEKPVRFLDPAMAPDRFTQRFFKLFRRRESKRPRGSSLTRLFPKLPPLFGRTPA